MSRIVLVVLIYHRHKHIDLFEIASLLNIVSLRWAMLLSAFVRDVAECTTLVQNSFTSRAFQFQGKHRYRQSGLSDYASFNGNGQKTFISSVEKGANKGENMR
jgi:hypothetical protein